MANERKFIRENVRRLLLKEYLREQVSRAGFGGLDIQRTPLGTRVKLIIERPGLVIGKRGGAIRDLTTALENEFSFDHPQIEVEEVKNPSLNAHIMAYKLAESLERGWHFRRAGHSTVRRIMEAGAVGCQVVLSGKLTGQRHRVEKFKQGHIKFCGEPRVQWVEEGFAIATVKLGVIGVKVQITHPDTKLPDEITVYDSIPEEKEEAAPETVEEEKPKEEAKPKEKKARKSRSSKKKTEKAEEKVAEEKKPTESAPAEKEEVSEPEKPQVEESESKEKESTTPEPASADEGKTEVKESAPVEAEKDDAEQPEVVDKAESPAVETTESEKDPKGNVKEGESDASAEKQ